MTRPSTSVDLWFPLPEVIDLAEHALAATEHRRPWDEDPVGPALVWVKDNGIYLFSNGLPQQPPTAADPAGNVLHAVYAHGHGQDSYHPNLPVSDHFTDYLALRQPHENDPPLIDFLLSAVEERWLLIEWSPESYRFALSVTGPRGATAGGRAIVLLLLACIPLCCCYFRTPSHTHNCGGGSPSVAAPSPAAVRELHDPTEANPAHLRGARRPWALDTTGSGATPRTRTAKSSPSGADSLSKGPVSVMNSPSHRVGPALRAGGRR
ncbi:hypothetical protein ACTD5D_10245 [Nocardia takedensis]|uniref:hypothetical protein n=1 Tax=Nocardia takedensis TaxID=259390 RepID=UPI003F776D6D